MFRCDRGKKLFMSDGCIYVQPASPQLEISAKLWLPVVPLPEALILCDL